MQKYTYTPSQTKPQNLFIDGGAIRPGVVLVSDKQADVHAFKAYVKAGLFTKVEDAPEKAPTKKATARRAARKAARVEAKTEVTDDN